MKFDTVAIDASPEFVAMYDAAVSVWQDTRQFMEDNGLTSGKWGQVGLDWGSAGRQASMLGFWHLSSA